MCVCGEEGEIIIHHLPTTNRVQQIPIIHRVNGTSGWSVVGCCMKLNHLLTPHHWFGAVADLISRGSKFLCSQLGDWVCCSNLFYPNVLSIFWRMPQEKEMKRWFIICIMEKSETPHEWESLSFNGISTIPGWENCSYETKTLGHCTWTDR